MWKVFKWIFALGLLAGIGWVAFKWYSSRSSLSIDALSLIPSDAIYCITTNDPINAWKEIAASGTWTHLQRNRYFASLTSSANNLDSLIRDNDLLFNLIGSRSLIVSAHMTGLKQYDFLFLVDLKEASGIKFLNEYLSSFTTEGLSVRKEKYKDEDIITIHNASDNSNLYASFPGNYLIASYNRKILTSSLDAGNNNALSQNETFIKASNELTDNSLMKLYLNYKMLPKFVHVYTNSANEYVTRLAQTLQTTALSVTLDNDLLKATGHTYINDSIESYVKTLAISGEGPTEFMEIAPQRTAFALALGFRSFREFFANFEKNVQQDVAEYKTYRNNLKQVEDYLGIDLQENFISWVGDEVALLELQSYGKGVNDETALIFKADNIEKAKKDLAHIEKMVRKKTPVKFKGVDYRGYLINYLSMKGLFKILLGKFFARYDKPYYVIINNFVVFSNHPQTLESIIDDYLNKTTLNKSEEFRDFRKQFDDESAVFVYLNTPVLFQSMKKLADEETRGTMETNKEYIVSFRHLGFQLVPEENGFKTTLAEKSVIPEPKAGEVAEIEKSSPLDSAEVDEPIEAVVVIADVDPMALPYIYAPDLNVAAYTGYFPDSTVHYEVELKNGFKNGSYIEYYDNGETKMKGHFKNDKRDGSWKLYNESGKLVMKRTYENDEVKREKTK